MNDILTARVLLTLTTVMITGAPLIADLNRTHATNPLWTGHARFHVVWQVLTYGCLGLVNLYLIWFSGSVENLVLSLAILSCIITAFYATALNVKRFGGAFYDQNGYLPFARVKLFNREIELDVNMTGFSIFTVVLLAAAYSLYRLP